MYSHAADGVGRRGCAEARVDHPRGCTICAKLVGRNRNQKVKTMLGQYLGCGAQALGWPENGAERPAFSLVRYEKQRCCQLDHASVEMGPAEDALYGENVKWFHDCSNMLAVGKHHCSAAMFVALSSQGCYLSA